MTTTKYITPKGEWKIELFRRWPFDRLRVRWSFEAELPSIDGEVVTLEFPPSIHHSGDAIWLCKPDGTFPTKLKAIE